MNTFTKNFIPLFIILIFVACKKEQDTNHGVLLDLELERVLINASDGKGIQYFELPESTDFGRIPQDPKNPITTEKVALGKLLYHETGLALNPKNPSSMNTYSCASCHFSEAGFQAGRHQGIGEGGEGIGMAGLLRTNNPQMIIDSIDVQPIRSPSTLNVAYQQNMLWNGQFGATGVNTGTEDKWIENTPIATNHTGFEGVEIQAIAGLGVHRLEIAPSFISNTSYKGLFDIAFGAIPAEERYTKITAGMAIAAYERTLLPNQAPFQGWLKGDLAALTPAQKRGAILFFDKAGCVSCHEGPALSKMDFSGLGMKDLFETNEPAYQSDELQGANLGRGGFTGKEADMFKFKVPQLYNLKDSPFYGHGSSFRNIEAVINYINEAIPQNPRVPKEQISPLFRPLGLSKVEIEHLTDFIENGLYDPALNRYEPDKLPSGLCFPNNDTQSKKDLGCQ